ncbi:MAG: InlB B-repeat-containing protein, partial [Clostridiales bacterium]|nr:InlB B-repeat-containing protein [Clostridiales bacterium]
MRKKSRRIRKLWGLLLAAALSVGLLSGLAAGTESARATEPVYTMTISVMIDVQPGNPDAAAPDQELSFVFCDWSGDYDCIAAAGGSIDSGSVTIDSYGENYGTITISVTSEKKSAFYLYLSDGFYIQLDEGGNGWDTIDTTTYLVRPDESKESGNAMGFDIEELADVESTSEAVASASFDDSVAASEPVLLASASESGMASAAILLAQAANNTSDINLYCTYTGWNLTFDTNGGSAIDTKAVGNGTAIDLSAYTPTRDGYTFSGWYSDSSLTSVITEFTFTENSTVYAGWTPIAT